MRIGKIGGINVGILFLVDLDYVNYSLYSFYVYDYVYLIFFKEINFFCEWFLVSVESIGFVLF